MIRITFPSRKATLAIETIVDALPITQVSMIGVDGFILN